MNYWLRLYTDILENRKAQQLEPELFKGWINLLCLAKENDGVLPEIPDIAFRLRIEDARAAELIEALTKKGLLDKAGDGFMPHNWAIRQYETEEMATQNGALGNHKRWHVSRGRIAPDCRYCGGDIAPDSPPNRGRIPPDSPPESRAEAEAEAETEKRQKQKQSAGIAAAVNGQGLYASEEHASRFTFERIKSYCKATKRITNHGGLARTLYRTGEEDEDIGEWIGRERKRRGDGETRARDEIIGPNDDFRLSPRPRSGAWGVALDEIERLIGKEATITWFEPLLFDEEANALIAPDPVFAEWIENNYREALDAGLEQAGLGRLEITTAAQ